MIQESIIKTIQLAIVSQCGQFCNYDGVNLTHFLSGCDDYNVTTIFLISITTSDPEQSAQTYYKLLGEWIITNPAFFSNNRTYQIDSNCAFLVEDAANSLSCDTPTVTPPTSTTQPTSTTTPTSRSTFVEVWIPIVVVIVFLLAVVAIAAIVIVVLCLNRKRKNSMLLCTVSK